MAILRFKNVEDAPADGQAVQLVHIDGLPSGGSATVGDGSITTQKLADGAVTGDKIGTYAVASNNIAEGAISTGKLETGCVDTDQLAGGAVTADKIADGTITAGKLAGGVIPSAYVLPAATTGALGGVRQAAHVASAAGDNVTSAEFEALLDALEAAGIVAGA